MNKKTADTTLRELSEKLPARLFADANSSAISAIDVTHDSRQVGPGTLFVAIRGMTSDGHRYIDDVMRRGAVGIISELDPPKDFRGAWLKVANSRIALAHAAAITNRMPSHELSLVGVTGTNGKTTTSYLMFELAKANGQKPAMLTTVEYRIGEESQPAIRTTPEASDTNRFLREAVEKKCTMAVMETSSQAIDLHRCDALRFRVAIFTNLTRDHLDYHVTMENYFDAKKKLFDGRLGEKPASSIINIDDDYGQRLTKELRESGQRVITFSQKRDADFFATDIEVSLIEGTSFVLKSPKAERRISTPLVGHPHVYNILSALAAALELGYDFENCIEGISRCVGAPGRFERVPNNKNFAVVVDYAHTDDALLNTLKTARELTKGRIITVFGCGGDRDKSKREVMGEVAGKYSDIVIITSDNPRNENPLEIISQIAIGIKKTNCSFEEISDRREAIHAALRMARKEDVVLIAGKGHETYQIIGSDKFHFDDREVASEFLAALEE